MNPYIYIGMAIQAFIVSILMASHSITVSPKQQAFAGIIFLALALVAFLIKKAI